MTEFAGIEAPLMLDSYASLPAEAETTHGPARGSVEWLLDAIEHHAMAEEDALEQYRYVSMASGDPVIALVMRLILEDEERHHSLLRRIEASLRDALEWTHSTDALPMSVSPSGPVAQDLAAAVGFLIDEEHAGARYMRQLARDEQRISAGLHTLLLETMALDSEKHAKLLGFVRDRLTARAQARDEDIR